MSETLAQYQERTLIKLIAGAVARLCDQSGLNDGQTIREILAAIERREFDERAAMYGSIAPDRSGKR